MLLRQFFAFGVFYVTPHACHVAERLGHAGAGLVPRRRASAHGAQLAHLVLLFPAHLAATFDDAGAVGLSRCT